MFSFSKKHTPDWKEVTELKAIATIYDASLTRPQLIFKHSTRCSISRAAYQRLAEGLEELEKQADVHYLDLLNHRNISDEIAEKTGIRHESPQIILIADGKAVYAATHSAIQVEEILKHL